MDTQTDALMLKVEQLENNISDVNAAIVALAKALGYERFINTERYAFVKVDK